MSLQKKKYIDIQHVYEIFTNSYPFRNLPFSDFESCLDLLDRNKIILYSKEIKSYTRRIKSYKYYYETYSSIPDFQKFSVIDSISLELNLAALERGSDAYCYASGMAATQAVLTLVKQGDRVVVSDNVYGGTWRVFTKVLSRYGVEFDFVDASDAAAFEGRAGDFAMLWIETPTNPLMKVCDIAALAGVAHRKGALLVVDNTFMSPHFQRPLELGADIVVHSTTKFLNGHSDSVGGAVIATRDDQIEWLRFVQNAEGAILGPMDAWLVLRACTCWC